MLRVLAPSGVRIPLVLIATAAGLLLASACLAPRSAGSSSDSVVGSPAPKPAPTAALKISPDPVPQDVDAPETIELAGANSQAFPEALCPGDMVEVRGDYCSEVEQRCEKSWYGKANKKTICEQFESPTVCVGSRAAKHYCIDRYSWPNREGERPEVMNNFYQAQVKCAAVGKRMCTESEWTLACEGPEMKPYPYGYVRDSNKCNGDRPWDSPDMKKVARRDAEELARLWQGVSSGAQPQCVSDYGVHDLPGNNDEVVASENTSRGWRGRYESVHTGGPWYLGVRNQCRPKIYSHDEGFYYYFLGFRCCSETAPNPTDPRTPKQLAKETDFGYVERLAGFGIESMQAKLKLVAKGECNCAARDRLCHTMCGTLLDASATDASIDPNRRVARPR